MVLEGADAVKAARQMIGATNPLEAAPGSIRGDFAIEIGDTIVHGSDWPESAAREIEIFFARPAAPPYGGTTRPRLALARAPDDPRALGVPSRCAPPASMSPAGRPAAGGCGKRGGQGVRRPAARAQEARVGFDTVVERAARSSGNRRMRPAREMLRALAGRTHTVVSGLAGLIGDDGIGGTGATAKSRTARDLPGRWTTRPGSSGTSATGEWRGRSGGYAIQGAGAELALAIDGEEENVVGPAARRCVRELLPRASHA